MAKVVGVLQAHMDGDFEMRLKGKQRALECWMDMKVGRWLSVWHPSFSYG